MRRLILLCAVLAACGSDSSTAPTLASLAGSWNLQTVNGSGLPFNLTPTSTTARIDIVSDLLVVKAAGNFTETTLTRTTTSTRVTTTPATRTGLFTLNGTAVTYQTSDGLAGTATVNGSTFTLASSGFSYVYKKQ